MLTFTLILNSLSDWLLSSSCLWLDNKFCEAGTEFRRNKFKKIDIFWMKRNKKWFFRIQTWFKFGGYSQKLNWRLARGSKEEKNY